MNARALRPWPRPQAPVRRSRKLIAGNIAMLLLQAGKEEALGPRHHASREAGRARDPFPLRPVFCLTPSHCGADASSVEHRNWRRENCTGGGVLRVYRDGSPVEWHSSGVRD